MNHNPKRVTRPYNDASEICSTVLNMPQLVLALMKNIHRCIIFDVRIPINIKLDETAKHRGYCHANKMYHFIRHGKPKKMKSRF